MKTINWLGVLGLVAALGACDGTSNPTAPATSNPPTPTPAPATSATERVAPSAGAPTLEVVPGSVSGCGQESWITSTVTWRINDDATARAKVVVSDPGKDVLNVFAEGAAEGSAKTENWVRSGTYFALLNAETGAELASYTVEGPDCSVVE